MKSPQQISYSVVKSCETFFLRPVTRQQVYPHTHHWGIQCDTEVLARATKSEKEANKNSQ